MYVTNDHAVWNDAELTRKVLKRRFGTVIRSEVSGLAKMMTSHAADAQRWISERVTDDGPGDTTEEETRMN